MSQTCNARQFSLANFWTFCYNLEIRILWNHRRNSGSLGQFGQMFALPMKSADKN